MKLAPCPKGGRLHGLDAFRVRADRLSHRRRLWDHQLDFEHLGDFAEHACDRNVGRTWRRIAARVIVRDDEDRRAVKDRAAEHFAGDCGGRTRTRSARAPVHRQLGNRVGAEAVFVDFDHQFAVALEGSKRGGKTSAGSRLDSKAGPGRIESVQGSAIRRLNSGGVLPATVRGCFQSPQRGCWMRI